MPPPTPEPTWVTDRIAVCEGTPPDGANAVVYAGQDVDLWARMLAEYLAEGRTVAVMGENARTVVDRYLQS